MGDRDDKTGATATPPVNPVPRGHDGKERDGHEEQDVKSEDDLYIARGADEADKARRRNAIEMIAILNGEAANVTPGTAMTYIPENNYYHAVDVSNGGSAMARIVESAYNWNALGRGKAAVYGAAIRWELKEEFSVRRETKVISVDCAAMSNETKSLVDGYLAALRPVAKQAAFWGVNAKNVAALAGALMISSGHHYDSANTRPQSALIGALGQSEDIDAESYRSLFYLSVHPLPLSNLEGYRREAADGKAPGYSEAVRIRSVGVPSGYGALAIAAAAFEGMSAEKYYPELVRKYGRVIDRLREILSTVKRDPTSYHVNATDYGVQRRVADLSEVKGAMIIGIAYARYVIKGTMQKAASAKKFYDQHKKAVDTWGAAFERAAEADNITIEELLR